MTGLETQRELAARAASWPAHGLFGASLVIADDEDLVVEGRDAGGRALVVSMHDVGPDIAAGFWDDELLRLTRLKHPAAAPVVATRIVDDRYFVVCAERPPGDLVRTRLYEGVLSPRVAATLLLAALEVAGALHGLGLSAAGMRLRSAVLGADADGRTTCVITSLGLRVDNDIEMFNELRELSLRVLSLVGGRYERTSGLVLPVDALHPELEAILRRAIGLARPAFGGTGEMAAAVAATLDTARPRGAPRSQVRTRPMAPGAPSMYASDLLLAEDLLASLPPPR